MKKFTFILVLIVVGFVVMALFSGREDAPRIDDNNTVINNSEDVVVADPADEQKEPIMDTPTSDTTTVVMKTNQGDITIEMYTGKAPITAGNFIKLAKEGFYDGVKYHRVIDGFMIQGGDPLSKDDAKQLDWGTGGPGYTIEDEFAEGLSNVRGTISMANVGPNTGGSQFFINLVDNKSLDGRHAVFGHVVEGMDVVDAIGSMATGPSDIPLEEVVIESIEIE